MFVYPARAGEVAALQQVFGTSVREVTFWDADFPDEAIEATGSRWALAEGQDADGTSLGTLQPGHPTWPTLEDLLGDRAETVRFGLQVVDRGPFWMDLEIENAYADGDGDLFMIVTRVHVTAPPPPNEGDEQAWDTWRHENVFEYTGTGRIESDAWYDVTVTGCSDPAWVGRQFAFGY
jgi:hypothetical protein